MILIAVLIFSGCAQKHPLVGNWTTVDQTGKESLLSFHADQTFEALGNGEKLSGQWLWRDETEPAQIELNFEQKKIVTIAKIQGNQLLIEPREGKDDMPSQFTDKVQKYQRR